jgi:hypothetical protein
MECEAWLAGAFGVELALAFDVPALRAAALDRVADPTTLELADNAGWPEAGGRPLASMPDGRGEAIVEVREHPGAGVLFSARGGGRFLVSPDARRVACARPAGREGDWQRLLVGQVLPLLAALRGLHVIHASAVSLGDTAIALAGASGAGKSRLAAELARAGHPMLAEDVLALRLAEGGPIAEPGVSLEDLPRAPSALPLRALCLLGPAEPGMPAIEAVPEPSPRDLMATTFVPYLGSGTGHLELAAALAGSVTVARVRVDRGVPPRTLAMQIKHFAESANPPASFHSA